MGYLYDACDQISDFCHQQLLRKCNDGRTEVKQYTPSPFEERGYNEYIFIKNLQRCTFAFAHLFLQI